MATSIVILSGPVDKRLFLQRYRPVVTPRIHDPNCLTQLAKNSLTKADESIAAAAQKQIGAFLAIAMEDAPRAKLQAAISNLTPASGASPRPQA